MHSAKKFIRTPFTAFTTNIGHGHLVKTHEIFSQNLDKGFDPDDPAVKGIEDWECSNNLDAMDPSLDNLVREIVKNYW